MNLFLSLLSSALLLLVISIAKCDEDLQHQINVLKDALAIEKQERILHIANNKKEINYLSEQVGQITGKLMDLSIGLSDLSEDFGNISGKLNELLTEVGDNTRDLNELSEKVGNSSQKLDNLSGEVRNNLVKLNSLSTEVGSNSGKLENLSTKVECNSEQLSDVAVKVGGISGLANEMSKEVGYNSGQLNGLSSEVGHNSGKLNDLSKVVEHISKGLNDLSIGVSNNSGKLSYLSGEFGRNSVSLNLLSGQVGNNSYQLHDLYTEVKDLSDEVGQNTLKGSIYFSANRKYPNHFDSPNGYKVVTYEELTSSSNDLSMNVENGIYTAPLDGVYSFSAEGLGYFDASGRKAQLRIAVNGKDVSYTTAQYSQSYWSSLSTTISLANIKKGDQISLKGYGSLSYWNDGPTQFSGYIISAH